MPSPMNIKQLSRLSGVGLQKILAMNLALKPGVASGQQELPKGYLLKIPPKSKQNILLSMQELYTEHRLATHHVVGKGDSLKKIAKRYDLEVKDLAMMNKMLTTQKLAPGQIIKLNKEDEMDLTLNNGEEDDEFELVVPDKLHTPVF